MLDPSAQNAATVLLLAAIKKEKSTRRRSCRPPLYLGLCLLFFASCLLSSLKTLSRTCLSIALCARLGIQAVKGVGRIKPCARRLLLVPLCRGLVCSPCKAAFSPGLLYKVYGYYDYGDLVPAISLSSISKKVVHPYPYLCFSYLPSIISIPFAEPSRSLS
jgi:hypothetical protein